MIKFIVNGTEYDDFMSASVTKSLSSLANYFSFTASAVNGFPPFKVNDRVVAIVNGKQQLDGYIGSINGSESEGSHQVSYDGRDKTADLIDSSFDTLGDLPGNLTLKRLIETVLNHINLNLNVIDLVNPSPFTSKEDKPKPEIGDNCYDFLLDFAKKKQCILTSNEKADIVITQSGQEYSNAVLQRLINSNNNNILSQSWIINNDERFNRYIKRAQQDLGALNSFDSQESAESTVNVGGVIYDEFIRTSRQTASSEDKGYSKLELIKRAEWAKQIAKAKSLQFNCTVKGHDYDGEVWKENVLVLINSEVADIQRHMLLDEVVFNESEGELSTSLKFVEKDVYTIDPVIKSKRKAGKQNGSFFLG